MGGRGVLKAKKIRFFQKKFIYLKKKISHGQRRALELVINVPVRRFENEDRIFSTQVVGQTQLTHPVYRQPVYKIGL